MEICLKLFTSRVGLSFLIPFFAISSLLSGSLWAAQDSFLARPAGFSMAHAEVGGGCTFGEVGVSFEKDLLSCVSGKWVKSSAELLKGTHCGHGYSRRGYSTDVASCQGHNPLYSCPSGYYQVVTPDMGRGGGPKPVDKMAVIIGHHYRCLKN